MQVLNKRNNIRQAFQALSKYKFSLIRQNIEEDVSLDYRHQNIDRAGNDYSSPQQ
jgi:hypothetical protein